jgi:DNA-binding CsgD family transcriptional regulator
MGSDTPIGQAPGSLIGRADDLEYITAFVDRAAVSGGALLLSGEAGVGKTALLEAAAAQAEAAGGRVLRAAGAEFESEVSFAGLNQLLGPLLDQAHGLSAAYRRALEVALGVREGASPDQLLLSNAVLALLTQATEPTEATEAIEATGTTGPRPVLAVVDDLPWLDRASAMVLGVVARRLPGSRVGFLAVSRSGEDGFFDRRGLPVHDVLPLTEAAAGELVGDRFPALAPRVRQRLLADARGNPLALLELPVALSGLQRAGTGPLPQWLPLSRRLRAVFDSRITALPAPARHLLLLAALDGTGSLPTLRSAAPGPNELDALSPAERSGLVRVADDGRRLEFRHPLTRSAVVALSTSAELRQAHAALARQLAAEPERRAWHLAQAAAGPDEGVAGQLEQAAHRIRQRGDATGAVTALLRAADLTPPGAERSRRLAEAAYLGAVVTGGLRDVPRLLDDARQADAGRAGSLVASVAAAHHLQLSGDGDIDTAHRLLVGAIEMQPEPYDAASATMVEALNTLGWVCYFGGRAELWAPFHRALGQLVAGVPESLALLSASFADPARTALPALGQLDAAVASLADTDPIRVARVGLACMYVDRLTGCRSALWRILRDGRDGGAVTLSLHALSLLGLDHFMTGEWDMLQALAEEHVSLCRAHNYRLLECRGLYLQAMLAAARGDAAATKTLTDQMTQWSAPRRVGAILRLAAQARTLAALTRGDFEAAYQSAVTITRPGELADHVPHALWMTLDLTEAAVRTGRLAEAAAHVAAVREAGLAAISVRQALITNGAAAMAAPDHEAAALFERALGLPGTDRWPFDRARIQLAFGERLRRMKAPADARTHLTAAAGTFQRLGAQPWAARASGELRATGQTIGQPAGDGPAALTPQQRQIATLAAAGLTNKQIGERLYLSPRTVATHLHQVFPKLGVTTRAALRDALASLPPADA